MTHAQINQSGEGKRRPWLRAIDFAAPSALAPDQQGRLKRLADDLCAVATARVMGELGLSVELNPLWLDERPWRDAHAVPVDDAVTTTLDSSAGGQCYMVLDATLASMIVERVLGVEPDPARPLRAVTTIDRALLSQANELLANCFDQLWEDATGATATAVEVAAHHETALAVDGAEAVMLLALEARLGSTYSIMYFIIPQSTVRPVALRLSRPSARGTGEDPGVSRAVHARISEANVDIQVRLGAVRMTAGEIAALHPGDRVAIPTRADAPAALIVDDVPVQYGHIGRSGDHRAVRVGVVERVA